MNSVTFMALQSYKIGERFGCFTLIVFLCLVTVNVLWPFLTVPWFGLECVVVVFPGYTHLLFETNRGSLMGPKRQYYQL